MYTTENYYPEDLVFEDLLDEDLLDDDDFDEDYYEDIDLDDGDLEFEEDFAEKRWRRPRGLRAYIPRRRRRRPSRFRPIPSRVKKRSNFSKPMQGRKSDPIAKGELKKIVDSISKEVNTLKKTVLNSDKSIKSLDQKFTQIANAKSRKDSNQTKVLKNMQMMNMLGSLLNKPTFDASNLTVESNSGKVSEVNPSKTIVQDSTWSLILPMLATAGDGKTGKSDMGSMLPLVLLMSQGSKNSTSGNSSSNDMMLPLMLMMMNK